MPMRSKLLLSAALAVTAITATTGTSAANRFSINEQGFVMIWSSLRLPVAERTLQRESVSCHVTLAGSLHSTTIAKTPGALIGNVTSARVASEACSGGTANALNGTERLPNGTTTRNTLPWHVIYSAFTGTLPIVRGIRIGVVGLSLLINARIEFIGSPVSCLYQSTANRPAFFTMELESTFEGPTVISVLGETSVIPIGPGQPARCWPEATLTGRGGGVTTALAELIIRLI